MSGPEPVEVYDRASLEAFTSELVAGGFEPMAETAHREWRGPIHPALSGLTDATTMRVVIRDGWPVVFPYLFVDGLHSHHLTADGYVCLWDEDDASGTWMTMDGLYNRIGQWCDKAARGWDAQGLARDALLNFQPKLPVVATFDLDTMELGRPGSWGDFREAMRHSGQVALEPGRPLTSQHLAGSWFRIGSIGVPPRSFTEVLDALSRAQRRGLQRQLERRRRLDVLQRSGGVDLVFLCWDRDDARDLLVLAISGPPSEPKGTALLPGPMDEQSLLLRAGPDATALWDRGVSLLGAGALGGHVALTLAESGVGQLTIIDNDVVLPGNAVRHLVGHSAVGIPKAAAIKVAIEDHAPWTKVAQVPGKPMTPSDLLTAIKDADLVVDATGNAAATRGIAFSSQAARKPLVAGALYRGGAVARVQRQGLPGDIPILSRQPSTGHTPIPPGDNEDEVVEPAIGCSAPINNAPPSSVTACAALITQTAVDALTGRGEFPDEIIDVYRALPGQPPFDRVGRVRSP